MSRPPKRWYALAGLALAGVGVAAALTQHFYEVRAGTAGFHSFCNLGGSMNCDVVAASPYAALLGWPISSFAGGWFLALFGVAILGTNSFWRREATRASLALTLFGSLFSAVYLAIMIFSLKTYCLLCLTTDALSFMSLALVLTLKPEGFSHHKADAGKWKTFAGLTVVALTVSALGLKALADSSGDAHGPDFDPARQAAEVLASPVLAVGAGDEFPHLGAEAAPGVVTIVEFSDFQCPYCRMGAFTLNSVMNHYASLPRTRGRLRVVFRNFPLDPSCNRYAPNGMHHFACEAAKTALCAQRAGRFEEVYQTLFENQASFAPGKPEELAKEAGVDGAYLDSCLKLPDLDAAISRDIEEAHLLGVESTPTFFIDGHKLPGAYPAEVWYGVLDELLK